MKTRREVVAELTKQLDSGVRGEDDLVVASFPYLPTNPQGITPYMAVNAVGVSRASSTPKRRSAMYFIGVYVFALYSNKTAAVNEADAWLALDNIEASIAKTIEVIRHIPDFWHLIEYVDTSVIDTVVYDNNGYLVEATTLRISVF
jgi:hypothetical protein